MIIKNIQKITNRRSKMRLIDADKLRKQIHCEYSDDLGILEKIDEQPTAYDIDGVIEQLKRCYGIVRSTSVDYAEGLKDAYERAIRIVKIGVRNEAD